MSLFDVIKYPISDSPSLEELNALPGDMIDILRHDFPSDWSLNKIACFLRVYPKFKNDRIKDLRKRLLEL